MVFGKDKNVNVDDVEKSKIITRGNAEGSGIFSCTAASHADEPFTCSSADEESIKKHLTEYKHYLQGPNIPCAICEKPINTYEIPTLAGRKPIHPECQQPVEEL